MNAFTWRCRVCRNVHAARSAWGARAPVVEAPPADLELDAARRARPDRSRGPSSRLAAGFPASASRPGAEPRRLAVFSSGARRHLSPAQRRSPSRDVGGDFRQDAGVDRDRRRLIIAGCSPYEPTDPTGLLLALRPPRNRRNAKGVRRSLHCSRRPPWRIFLPNPARERVAHLVPFGGERAANLFVSSA